MNNVLTCIADKFSTMGRFLFFVLLFCVVFQRTFERTYEGVRVILLSPSDRLYLGRLDGLYLAPVAF